MTLLPYLIYHSHITHTSHRQSHFGVEELRVLLGVEGKLEVIQHLLLDLPILKEYYPVPVTFQIFIVSHHHYSYPLFMPTIPKVIYLQNQVHHIHCRSRVQVPCWFIQQYYRRRVG